MVPLAFSAVLGGCSGNEARGRAIYRQACVGCHGERGDGRGAVAALQRARPRNFLTDAFRNAPPGEVPSDEVLLRVVTEGMPDGVMPAFRELSEADRRAVVSFVKAEFLAKREARR